MIKARWIGEKIVKEVEKRSSHKDGPEKRLSKKDRTEKRLSKEDRSEKR